MSVLLLPNRMKDDDLTVTRTIISQLSDAGTQALLPDEFSADLSETQACFLPREQAFLQASQVITVGGDGTLLRVAPECAAYRKPVLGVNLGRTGFLATCEVGELERKIPRLLAGEYSLESRHMLLAQVAARKWSRVAMNDVVLFGHSRLHPMDYTVYCDGVFVSRYRSDGVIAATPAGSTAYSLSAGGPVLDARAPVMVLTPVCAHGMHSVPLVFSADRHLTIVAEKDNREPVYASADSNAQCDMQPGDVLDLTTAPESLQLIVFDGSEQFHAIETKLMRR